MAGRCTFRSQNYWRERIDRLTTRISEFEDIANMVETSTQRRLQLRFDVSIYTLELFITMYSSGSNISQLRDFFSVVVNARQNYVRLTEKPLSFDLFDTYIHTLWMVSLAILLDIPRSEFERLVNSISNLGCDGVYDRLVALRLDHEPTHTLLYPRPYEFLCQALDAPPDMRRNHIQEFLKRYYRGMRHAYWYDQHRHPKSGFFGYWCFELAAFVKALGIDDQDFADNLYYPRDLVVSHTDCA
jgi:hypothetical protein